MAWVKGDGKWHFAEQEGIRKEQPFARLGCVTICDIFLSQRGFPTPIDDDPKCEVCEAAQP